MNVVYGFKCSVSSKYYVGSSGRFRVRKAEHVRHLNQKKHHSSKLQNAWNKYGGDSFQFEVLETVENLNDLKDREQFWIDSLDSYFNGYNSYRYARPCLLGESHGMYGKQGHSKGSVRSSRKPIISYEVSTGQVELFDCVLHASRIFGPQFLACISIEKIGRTKCRKFKGKFWFYKTDFCLNELKKRFLLINAPFPLNGRKRPINVGLKISKSLTGKKLSKEHIENMSKGKLGTGGKKIKRSDGVIFNTIREAGKITGCCGSQISHVLSGRTKTCRGYSFSYLNEGEL